MWQPRTQTRLVSCELICRIVSIPWEQAHLPSRMLAFPFAPLISNVIRSVWPLSKCAILEIQSSYFHTGGMMGCCGGWRRRPRGPAPPCSVTGRIDLHAVISICTCQRMFRTWHQEEPFRRRDTRTSPRQCPQWGRSCDAASTQSAHNVHELGDIIAAQHYSLGIVCGRARDHRAVREEAEIPIVLDQVVWAV